MNDVETKPERIEKWRNEAFEFSSSDRLGVVACRALEALMIVVKNGAGAQSLKDAAESLGWEWNRTFQKDNQRNDPARRLVYGICESLQIAIDSMCESGKNNELVEVKEEQSEDLPVETGTEVKEETTEDGYIMTSEDYSIVAPPDPSNQTFGNSGHSQLASLLTKFSCEGEGHSVASTSSAAAAAHATSPGAVVSSIVRRKRVVSNQESRSPQHHQSGPLHTCQFCSKLFSTAYQLMQHTNSAHNGIAGPRSWFKASRLHSCGECGQNFKEQYLLTHHMERRHKGNNYACTRCGKYFRNKALRLDHMHRDHQSTSLICSGCGFEFNTQSLIDSHLCRHQS